MEHNKLQYADNSAFIRLKELTQLQLSWNQLTLHSKPFGYSLLNECTKLEEVYLAYNNITMIYEDWSNTLTNLRILDLKHNAISNLIVSITNNHQSVITDNIIIAII